MSGRKLLLIGWMFIGFVQPGLGQDKNQFCLQTGQPVTIACDTTQEEAVVTTALQLFTRDCEAVLSVAPRIVTKSGQIVIGTLGKSSLIQDLVDKQRVDITGLSGKKESFLLSVIRINRQPTLVIAGSDKRGTAYGILEVSRLMGVSPWEWWADATPEPLSQFILEGKYRNMQSPSVEFRGIFINDEDWGLMPWSSKTYEPSENKGEIGPATHRRVFELLLRLRANTYWPAMHECTKPFYFTPGNQEVADAYGIYIGTSHCEPMMRNTNGEWATDGEGEYDYVHNRSSVYRFWEKRVAEVANQDNIYTLGIRGVHDGKMQGAKTLAEQTAALKEILVDQRGLLKKYVAEDATTIPQVFIPYKEVLDIYHAGLQVPDDITLMWCDDNYGYIRHFPDSVEQARRGGNGVYYHISYWGRPHDYLWLGTTQPALIYNQMKQAYDSGIQKMWILNVGDIKPAEYQTELFLDMAWNLDKVVSDGVTTHLSHWLTREFGFTLASQLVPLMQESYRLAFIRKPEFMGHTRVEEKDPIYKKISDLPWSEQEIRNRLVAYDTLSEKVQKITAQIPKMKRDTYFQLVQYPIQAATQMNRKMLMAQLARHNKEEWAKSDIAFDSIVALTHIYNTLNKGKWNRIMDDRPRLLPVFERVKPTEKGMESLPAYRVPVFAFNGADYTIVNGKWELCEGLGYNGKALALHKGSSVAFQWEELKYSTKLKADSIEIEVRLLPNHPVRGNKLRFSLSLDNAPVQIIEYQTQGRSEEWKENVLRNQSIRRLTLKVAQRATHELKLIAVDEGVVIDQVLIYN